VRFCFKAPELAEAFRARFGNESISSRTSARGLTSGLCGRISHVDPIETFASRSLPRKMSYGAAISDQKQSPGTLEPGASGRLPSRPQLENAGTANKGIRICAEAL
jgi:hypothetical protein